MHVPPSQQQPRNPVNSADLSQERAYRAAYEAQHRALAHWLIEIHQQPTHRQLQLWHLMSGSRFADTWYAARISGEMLRGEALRWLSLHQPQPGGTNPDPRTPSDRVPFSPRAIVTVAASQILHVSISPTSEAVAQATADLLRPGPDAPRPLCWIIAYPNGIPPTLAVRHMTQQHTKLIFDMAQLLGFINSERHRLADPDAPGGTILLPTDTAIETVLHQFAIALLGLPQDCPDEWPCACNALRARYNAAPASHDQASEALSLGELRAIRSRQPAPAPPTRPLDPTDR